MSNQTTHKSLMPAAQYVRMSTEDQIYSIENQKDAIAKYAERLGFLIVATYSDSGKSGLSIKNRNGLQSLLRDVVGGESHFKTILVYDVSRWGRFQDTDEAAHYEFICRNAGIPVRYCAEQFDNDGSMPSSIMKALKRTMAAEYSRELGVKVYQGQHRLVLRGYKIGGGSPYALRRVLVSANGHRKQVLKPHERKNIKSDHIILEPGSPKEISCVRKIFAMGVSKANTPSKIADELNKQGLRYADGRIWNEQFVFRILKNPVYIGANVWGRTTKTLTRGTSKLPPEKWITKRDAFEPLIDVDMFDRAQRAIRRRKTSPKKPDEYYLKALRKILAREGKLTERLLKKLAPFHYQTCSDQFGSILDAYRLAGYEPSPFAIKCVERQKRKMLLYRDLYQRVKALFPDHVRLVSLAGQRQRSIFELDKELRVAVHIGRPADMTKAGPRWLFKAYRFERKLPALLCTVNQDLTKLLNFYIVPEFGTTFRKYLILGENHPFLTVGRKLNSLNDFYNVAREVAADWIEKDDTTVVGDVTVTARTSTISIGSKEILLPQSNAEIFKALVYSADKVVPKKNLFNIIRICKSPHLRAHMCKLREKLGPKVGRRIETVKGIGYMYRSHPRLEFVGSPSL